eukprot:scaffold6939_cov69-Phaeocystis_antarctica.AAC.5
MHGQQPPAQTWPLPTHFEFPFPASSITKGDWKASGPTPQHMQHGMGDMGRQPAIFEFLPTPLLPSSAKVIVNWGAQHKIVPHVMPIIMLLAQQLAQPSSQQPTGYISLTTPSIALISPLYSTTPMTVGCCAAGRHAAHQPVVFVWRRLHGVRKGVADACGQQAKGGGSAHWMGRITAAL